MQELRKEKGVVPVLEEGSLNGLIRVGPLTGVEELFRGKTVKHALERVQRSQKAAVQLRATPTLFSKMALSVLGLKKWVSSAIVVFLWQQTTVHSVYLDTLELIAR